VVGAAFLLVVGACALSGGRARLYSLQRLPLFFTQTNKVMRKIMRYLCDAIKLSAAATVLYVYVLWLILQWLFNQIYPRADG
jgi:hypothetical protein